MEIVVRNVVEVEIDRTIARNLGCNFRGGRESTGGGRREAPQGDGNREKWSKMATLRNILQQEKKTMRES